MKSVPKDSALVFDRRVTGNDLKTRFLLSNILGFQMNQTSHIPIEPENVVLMPTSLLDQFVAITE